MTEIASKLRNIDGKRYALLPAKLILWAAQGRLRSNLRASRDYRFVASSGLFDVAFYRKEYGHSSEAQSDPVRHYLTRGASEGYNPNPLFDSRWYLMQNPDVASRGTNPLVHFLRSGWQEGRSPHPLFDVSRYVQLNGHALLGENPLAHYLRTGKNEQRDPHILFDNKWYLGNNPDVASGQVNPLVHYLQTGCKEGRDPHPLFSTDFYLRMNPQLVEREINPLLDFVTDGFKVNRNPNALFDCAYYAKLYPDVAKSDTNSLIHYILSGGPELRSPHALFDPLYYTRQVPEATARTINPLAHYFASGVKRRLSPHPLFDVRFYLEQHPNLAPEFGDLVRHYIEQGAELGSDPCELFDTSYYLEHYPQVAESGKNPLVHYLTEGVKAGTNPNPLFDTAFYLKQYPDVELGGQNPLVHYIEAGALEGRAPSPFFDSLYYLRKNPKVREGRINPLAHYLVRGGAEDGRDPSAYFSTSNYLKEHPEIRKLGINPLVHFIGADRPAHNRLERVPPSASSKIILRVQNVDDHDAPARILSGRPAVLCASHVSPYLPRAGNEYRINRLLHAFKANGYDVLPVISLLPGEPVSHCEVRKLAQEFGDAVFCMRDGTVLCSLNEADMRALLAEEGAAVPEYAIQLGENKAFDPEALNILNIERTFCHDTLVHILLKLASARKPCIVVAEYVFMSRFLALLEPGILKVIDTHDVFSSKREKVVAYGISDGLSLSDSQERELLTRADLILAIQPEEQDALERLIDGTARVVTVGVDFPLSHTLDDSPGQTILYVGSDNSMNVKGLRDFIRFAWPSIAQAVPEAELLIAGKVCGSVRATSPRIKLLGSVEDLAPLYAQAKVVINPAVAGTGLKVKTLEALSFLRPLVTWPTGVEGLTPKLASFCSVAIDWFEFHQNVIGILKDIRSRWFTDEDAKAIEDQLSAAAVYAPLQKVLSTISACSSTASV